MKARSGNNSPMDASESMLSVFGMAEMETAAKIIVAKARAAGRWIPVELSWFVGPENLLGDGMTRDPGWPMTGFANLLAHGWLEPSWEYAQSFRLTKKFIARVTSPAAKRYDPRPSGV